MDPADSGNQCVQMERHGLIHREVMEKFRTMWAQITQTGTQLEVVSSHLAQAVLEPL